MNRKEFFQKSFLVGTGAVLTSGKTWGSPRQETITSKQAPFSMKFAPDFNIFNKRTEMNVIDQIRWGYDMGFRAWENTWLARRPVEEQEKISGELQRLGMEFGQFVGASSFREVVFAGRSQELREKYVQDVKASVEIAKRMNTRFIHNVLGKADPKLPWDFQMANAIELLKRVAEVYESNGLVMVMETMNHKVNHPGMFLHSIPQAYALCKAVGSPSLKILFDVYHVQIQEGNLINTLNYAWDEIAYFQLGDNPGRFEPGTGEINYKNLLKHIWDKGYRGFLGLEHKVKESDQKAIEAYRAIDPQ